MAQSFCVAQDVIEKIFYMTDTKTQIQLRRLCKLFRTIPITHIDRGFGISLRDERILHFPSLISLDVSNNYYMSGFFFDRLPQLEALNISKTKIITNSLMNLPQLKSLIADDMCISDDAILNLPLLETLHMTGRKIINNIILNRLPNLRELTIDIARIIMYWPETFDKLETLIMRAVNITDKELKCLPQLKTLTMNNCSGITDEGIKCLTQLETLNITVYHNEKRDIIGTGFANLQQLKSLSVGEMGMTDVGFKYLAPIKTLKTLKISGCENITDEGLEYLSHLETLDISYSKNISGSGFKNFQQLKSLRLYDTNVTDIGFEYLTQLESLDYEKCVNITGIGLCHLRQLKTLRVHNTTIMDVGFEHLTRLETLDMPLTQITYSTEIMGEKFWNLSQLKTLIVPKTNITRDTLRHLPMLKAIDAHYTVLEDDWLEYLPSLDTLNVSHTRITDEGFRHVPQLKFLNVTCTNVTGTGLKYLSSLEILLANETKMIDEMKVKREIIEYLARIKFIRVMTRNTEYRKKRHVDYEELAILHNKLDKIKILSDREPY